MKYLKKTVLLLLVVLFCSSINTSDAAPKIIIKFDYSRLTPMDVTGDHVLIQLSGENSQEIVGNQFYLQEYTLSVKGDIVYSNKAVKKIKLVKKNNEYSINLRIDNSQFLEIYERLRETKDSALSISLKGVSKTNNKLQQMAFVYGFDGFQIVGFGDELATLFKKKYLNLGEYKIIGSNKNGLIAEIPVVFKNPTLHPLEVMSYDYQINNGKILQKDLNKAFLPLTESSFKLYIDVNLNSQRKSIFEIFLTESSGSMPVKGHIFLKIYRKVIKVPLTYLFNLDDINFLKVDKVKGGNE